MIVVQEPFDCAAPGMPQAVLVRGGADFVLPAAAIGHALVALSHAPRQSSALFGLPNLLAPQ